MPEQFPCSPSLPLECALGRKRWGQQQGGQAGTGSTGLGRPLPSGMAQVGMEPRPSQLSIYPPLSESQPFQNEFISKLFYFTNNEHFSTSVPSEST